MFRFIEKLFVVLSLVAVFGNTEVTVENGRYGVLVSFSQNVRPENGTVLLDNMKATLEEASAILHNAIGLHFSKVTFRLPASWDTSELNITVEDSFDLRNSKSDFLIDSTNDVVFGKLALAQQYGSCGVPGKQIIIPTAFFDEFNVFPKGTTLAREWLKYRYGVFDENGYFGDPIYPLYYTTPGSDPSEVKITDCTNTQVTYNFLDQDDNNCSALEKTLIQRLDSGECKIRPDEENITSSMMYFQKDIPTMQHICGKDADYAHNSRSPNKQNILCNGQSIWDIVKNSSDFQKEITAEEFDAIEYAYVQEAKPKIVVAWENTRQMKGPIVLNAIKKFVIDLPNGSKFNGFPFKANVQTPDKRDYTLHDLNGFGDKKRISEDISSDFVISEDGDINLAISKALEVFSSATSDSKIEGTIVIITKSIQKLNEELLGKLDNSKVCVKLMFFGEGDAIPEEVQSYTSTLSCATFEKFLTSDEDKDTFEKLYRAMETLLPSAVDDKETETVKTEYLTQESSVSVEVDSTVASVTFWVFSKKESDNFDLKFNGRKETGTSEDFGSILAISYSPSDTGIVEFSFPHETEKMLTHVRVTYKEGKYINGEVFIHDTSEEQSSVQMPVIIYALIRFGAYPVQSAEVLATIEGPDGSKIDLGLNDDGKGDPDITKNDGIYSRYFTSFSEKGEYTVTVTVGSNNYATFGVDKESGYQTCCGSYVNDGTSKLPRKFSKVFKTTFKAKNGRPDDGYKPSRILDLRVDRVTDDKIVLKWTAPGGEADSGTAQSYEIKHFPSQDEAVNNFDSGMSIFNYTASPKYRGETESFEIDFSNFEKEGLCFLAMKAKNSNKTSDLSNTIEIFVPDRKTTEPPNDDKDKDTEKDPKQSGVNNKTVGIVIGSIVGVIIAVIIIYLAIYYLVVKPKHKKEVKEHQASRAPLPPSENINPINFISAATLIEHHNEKTKAKIENKEPRIFKEEDFVNKNPLPTNELGESSSNNEQELDNKNKVFQNGEPMPPKSPKRTTFV